MFSRLFEMKIYNSVNGYFAISMVNCPQGFLGKNMLINNAKGKPLMLFPTPKI